MRIPAAAEPMEAEIPPLDEETKSARIHDAFIRSRRETRSHPEEQRGFRAVRFEPGRTLEHALRPRARTARVSFLLRDSAPVIVGVPIGAPLVPRSHEV